MSDSSFIFAFSMTYTFFFFLLLDDHTIPHSFSLQCFLYPLDKSLSSCFPIELSCRAIEATCSLLSSRQEAIVTASSSVHGLSWQLTKAGSS